MGSAQSELCHRPGEDPVGYRILTVQPNSPATSVTVVHNGERQLMKEERLEGQSLVPYFDFIISINGKRLDEDNGFFIQEVKRNEGQEVELEVFNAKCNRMRVVKLIPHSFGGTGMLGLSIRFDTYLGTRDNILRVLDVKPDSPADLAGLTPLEDYILAAEDSVFECLDDFGDYLIDKEGEQITLFVYNSGRDSVREVPVLVSTKPWGDDNDTGLGVSVGTGRLHELPNQDSFGFPDFAQLHSRPSTPPTQTVNSAPDSYNTPPSISQQLPRPEDCKRNDGDFSDVPLDTPIVSGQQRQGAVNVSLNTTATSSEFDKSGTLPSWDSDESGKSSNESDYEGETDDDDGEEGGYEGSNDVNNTPERPSGKLQFVDEHSHSHN